METITNAYVNAGGGSARRRRTCRELLDRWKAAGFPENYREDQSGRRIIDMAARRERLNDLIMPVSAELRKQRGELLFKRKMARLSR